MNITGGARREVYEFDSDWNDAQCSVIVVGEHPSRLVQKSHSSVSDSLFGAGSSASRAPGCGKTGNWK